MAREMKTVKVGGKEMQVAFSMGAVIDWEKTQGMAFNPGESLRSNEGQLTLCWCILRRYNKDWKVGLYEFVDAMSFGELLELQKTIASCMSDFYRIPEDEKSEEKNEGEPKNV